MALTLERTQGAGKREDLADILANVDAHDTIVSSTCKKGSKPGNTLMSHVCDSYSAAVSSGTVDGVDVGASDYQDGSANRALVQNYVQIFRRSVRVSTLAQEISNIAGVGSGGELANSIAKAIIEIKRDIEKTVLSANDAQLDAGGSTPYLTKGLATWISTAGGAVLQVPSGFRTPAGSINSATTTALITDVMVQNVLSSIFGETGSTKNYLMPVGRTLRRAFTDRLTGTRSVTDASNQIAATQVRTFSPQKGKTVSMSVDTFDGDFGILSLANSNFMAADTDGFVLDSSGIELRYGSLPSVSKLPNAGGGEARMIEAIAALIVYNPLSHGKFDLAS
jgi:hypothetical protein